MTKKKMETKRIVGQSHPTGPMKGPKAGGKVPAGRPGTSEVARSIRTTGRVQAARREPSQGQD